MENFTWIDWVMTVIVMISIIISIKRGFFKEILSFFAWIIAVVVASIFAVSLAEMFVEYIDKPSMRILAARSLIFLAVLVIGGIINSLITTLVDISGLSVANRLFGAVFGGLRGFLLVFILLELIASSPLKQDNAWEMSVLLPHVLTAENFCKKVGADLVEPLYQEGGFIDSLL